MQGAAEITPQRVVVTRVGPMSRRTRVGHAMFLPFDTADRLHTAVICGA